MTRCQGMFKEKCQHLRKLKIHLSVSFIDQSLEGSTAPEKENAIACATSTPVAQMHQHFGRCNAVSLTPFPTRMNYTTGFQFLIQVRSYDNIFQIQGRSHHKRDHRMSGMPCKVQQRENCTMRSFILPKMETRPAQVDQQMLKAEYIQLCAELWGR